MNRISLVFFVCFFCFFSGCGEADNEIEPGPHDGKELGELTIREYMSVCEEFNEYVVDGGDVKSSCYLIAVFESNRDESMDCETLASNCIADPESFNVFGSKPDDCSLIAMELPDTCNATVLQIKECFRDRRQLVLNYSDGLNCNNLSERGEFPSTAIESLESCKEAQDSCPSVSI